MEKVNLPEDELPHEGQAIEWWYFNGFLHGEKSDYAFMTCLFKADGQKINFKFIHSPLKNFYFSHSLLFNLKTGKIEKEVLPIVITSSDSNQAGHLCIDYYNPVSTSYVNYCIAREEENLQIKNRYLNLSLTAQKPPLLENQTGYINLEQKSTYYYSYSHLAAKGFVGNDPVTGLVWHDKQWSEEGYKKDAWLWFSLQLPNNVDIVCFDYLGQKMATISDADGKLTTVVPEFTAKAQPWHSPHGSDYVLEWQLKIGDYTINTKPVLTDCEMSYGNIHYWEGPIEIECDGNKANGFMEYLIEAKTNGLLNWFIEKEQKLIEKFNH